MRYHTKPKDNYETVGITYKCNHPCYDVCTLYLIGNRGLAVIQQRFDEKKKATYWTQIDGWLTKMLYDDPSFMPYFKQHAGEAVNGLYPTVTIRKIMWAFRMKPLKKEVWETAFERRFV